MIKSTQNVTVSQVSHFSIWGPLGFTTESGDEITVQLTDEQWEELERRVVNEVKRKKERKLEKLREELEELENAEADD